MISHFNVGTFQSSADNNILFGAQFYCDNICYVIFMRIL